MKKDFKNLVKKMEALQEDQQGKLRGGFSSFSGATSSSVSANNCNCTNNKAGCGQEEEDCR